MENIQEKPKSSKLTYRKFLIVPAIVFVVSLALLFNMIATDSLMLDVDFSGGTEINIESPTGVDADEITDLLSEYDATVRVGRGVSSWSVIITIPIGTDTAAIMADLEAAGYDFDDYAVQTVGPALGESFLQQAITALVIAFIAMAITVFIIFRVPLPSFYVIFAGLADIVEALVFSQLLGIDLSLASFAALLLLLGYSVDTDILLTTRLLKSEGSIKRLTNQAMKTGLTMTSTTMATLSILFMLSVSPVITQIAAVLVIGLAFDVMNTWMMNAGLLRIYMEKRGRK